MMGAACFRPLFGLCGVQFALAQGVQAVVSLAVSFLPPIGRDLIRVET
jgi:hypothetical protein